MIRCVTFTESPGVVFVGVDVADTTLWFTRSVGNKHDTSVIAHAVEQAIAADHGRMNEINAKRLLYLTSAERRIAALKGRITKLRRMVKP